MQPGTGRRFRYRFAYHPPAAQATSGLAAAHGATAAPTRTPRRNRPSRLSTTGIMRGPETADSPRHWPSAPR